MKMSQAKIKNNKNLKKLKIRKNLKKTIRENYQKCSNQNKTNNKNLSKMKIILFHKNKRQLCQIIFSKQR